MRTLQDTVPLLVNFRNPLPRRRAPSEEDHAFRSHLGYGVDDFLRELRYCQTRTVNTIY